MSLGVHSTHFTSVCGSCADANLTFVFLGQIPPSQLQTRVAVCPLLLYMDVSEAPQTPFLSKPVPSISVYGSTTTPWSSELLLKTSPFCPFSPTLQRLLLGLHIVPYLHLPLTCHRSVPHYRLACVPTGMSRLASLTFSPSICATTVPFQKLRPDDVTPTSLAHIPWLCSVLRTQKRIDLSDLVTSPSPSTWSHLLVLHSV